METQTFIPVTERALIQRINRRLQKGEKLRTARGQFGESSLGRYFIVDANRNSITAHHVDLKKLARDVDVLQPWEEMI